MINLTSKQATIILCIGFMLFITFGILRSFPINTNLSYNGSHTTGVAFRHVDRVFNFAKKHAKAPYDKVKDHFLYHKRNPGLFLWIAEMFIRITGEQQPFYLQLFCFALFCVGLIFFYQWVLILFEKRFIAVLATIFLMFTPYALYFSNAIHQDSYSFCFFNLTIYFYFRYMADKRGYWLILSTVTYFLLCMNYYMFFLSTFIFIIGIHYYYTKRIFSPAHFIVTIAPILALCTVLIQMIIIAGGIDGAIHRLGDIFVARTVDMRVEDASFFPDKTFMDAKAWLMYPLTVSRRIFDLFYFPIWFYLILMVFIYLWSKGQDKERVKLFFFIVPAGLSWYVTMFQHTFIHGFAGIYSFFVWPLALAFFISLLHQKASEQVSLTKRNIIFGSVVVCFLIFIVVWGSKGGFIYHYLDNLNWYIIKLSIPA